MKIGLIRHGRTEWNDAGKLQGRTDIPISEQERQRLSSLALPPVWGNADILSSPLSRARETAEILTQKPPRIDNSLIEMNLGAWEGLRGVDLLDDPESGYRHVEEWGWDHRPPGGESPRDVLARIKPSVDALATDTVIVSHINIMRVLLAVAYDWDFIGEMPFRIKRNRIHVIERHGDTWRPAGDPIRLIDRCG